MVTYKTIVEEILQELSRRIGNYENNKFYKPPYYNGRLRAELHSAIQKCDSLKEFILDRIKEVGGKR